MKQFKVLMLGLMMGLLFIGCKKEVEKATVEEKCNCGDVVGSIPSTNGYSISVTNDCSGNTYAFAVSNPVYHGRYCTLDGSSW